MDHHLVLQGLCFVVTRLGHEPRQLADQSVESFTGDGGDRLDALHLVRRHVALGTDDDARSFEKICLVVPEFTKEDLELFLGRVRRELSDRSSKTHSTRARST